MRRHPAYPLILATLLTLAFAGCRQEPLPGAGSAIRFSVRSGEVYSAPTKAELPVVTAPGDYLQKSGNVVPVWGSSRVGSGAWSNVFKTSTLGLICDESGTGWDYEGDRYYWNAAGTFKFRSVFTDGHDADIQSGSADAVTVAYPGGYDLMVSGITVPPGANQEANLRFLHASAAVRFFCVDESRGDAISPNYSVTSFRLKNIRQAGTLVYDGVSSASGAAVTGWTPGSAVEVAYARPGSSEAVWPMPVADIDASEANTALTPWLYLVPQDLGADAGIELSFRTKSGQTIDVARLLTATGMTGTWEAGKMYAYFIKLRPTGIEFSVTWTSWGDPEVHNLTGE